MSNHPSGDVWAFGPRPGPARWRVKRRSASVVVLSTAFLMLAATVALADQIKADSDVVSAGVQSTPVAVALASEGTTNVSVAVQVLDQGAGTASFPVAVSVVTSNSTGTAVGEPAASSVNVTGYGSTGQATVSIPITAPAVACDTVSNLSGRVTFSTTATGFQGGNNTDFVNINVTVTGAECGPTLTAPTLHLPDDISVLATSAAGALVEYEASASDENGAVAITCVPASGSTFAPGTTTVNCSATNAAGTTNGSFSVAVSFGFVGFDRPVDTGALNAAKAGQAIPLKFQVTGAGGVGIIGLTAPPIKVSVANYNCGLTGTTDLVEEYAAGSSGLQDLGGGYYQFNWKTPKDYAGSCKTMTLALGDGDTSHTALFKFTK
jgi:hypothetical protein